LKFPSFCGGFDREFQIESGTKIIYLPVPSAFRSSQRARGRGYANIGTRALVRN
jgi:hypothetical protein